MRDLQSTGIARCASVPDTVNTRLELESAAAISKLEEQRKLETLPVHALQVITKSKSKKPSTLGMLRNMLTRPKSEPATKKDKEKTSPSSMVTERPNMVSGGTPNSTKVSSTEDGSDNESGTWGGIGPMQSTQMANTLRPMDVPSRSNNSTTAWDSHLLAGQYIKELDAHPYLGGDLECGNGEEDTNTNAFYRRKIAASAPPTRSDNRFEEARSICAGVAGKPLDAVVGRSKVFYVDPSNIDDILAKRDFHQSSSLPRGRGRSRSLGRAVQSLHTRTRSHEPNRFHGSLPTPRGRIQNPQQHSMHPQRQITPAQCWDAEEYPLEDSTSRQTHTDDISLLPAPLADEVAGDHVIFGTTTHQDNSPGHSSSLPVAIELNRAPKNWSHRPVQTFVESSIGTGTRTEECYPQGISSTDNDNHTDSATVQDDLIKHQSEKYGRSSAMTTFSIFMPYHVRAHEDNPMPKLDNMLFQSAQPSSSRQTKAKSSRYNTNNYIPPVPRLPKEYGSAASDVPSVSAQATQGQDWTSSGGIESLDRQNSWQSHHTERTWADILAIGDIPVSPETIKYDCYATYSPVSPFDSEYEVNQWTGSQEILLCYSPETIDRVDSLQLQRRCSQDSKPIPSMGRHNEPANVVSDLRSQLPVFSSSLPAAQHGFLPQSPSDENESFSWHNPQLSSHYTSSAKSQNSQPTTPRNFSRPDTLLAAQTSLEATLQQQNSTQHAQTLPNTRYTPEYSRPIIPVRTKKSPARAKLPQTSRTLPNLSNSAQDQFADIFPSSIQPLKVQKIAPEPFEVYKRKEEERWREAEKRLKGKRDGRGGDERLG